MPPQRFIRLRKGQVLPGNESSMASTSGIVIEEVHRTPVYGRGKRKASSSPICTKDALLECSMKSPARKLQSDLNVAKDVSSPVIKKCRNEPVDSFLFESEEDFKPDYDEDDRQDIGTLGKSRGPSTSCRTLREAPSSHLVRDSISPAIYIDPDLSYSFDSSYKKQSFSSLKDDDKYEYYDSLLHTPTQSSGFDVEVHSEQMEDLSCLDDNQLLSRMQSVSQHTGKSPISVPVPHRVIWLDDCPDNFLSNPMTKLMSPETMDTHGDIVHIYRIDENNSPLVSSTSDEGTSGLLLPAVEKVFSKEDIPQRMSEMSIPDNVQPPDKVNPGRRKICLKRPWKTANKELTVVEIKDSVSKDQHDHTEEKVQQASDKILDLLRIQKTESQGSNSPSFMVAASESASQFIKPAYEETEETEELLEGDGSSDEDECFKLGHNRAIGDAGKVSNIQHNASSPRFSAAVAHAVEHVKCESYQVSSFAKDVEEWVSQRSKMNSLSATVSSISTHQKPEEFPVVDDSLTENVGSCNLPMKMFEELTAEDYSSDFEDFNNFTVEQFPNEDTASELSDCNIDDKAESLTVSPEIYQKVEVASRQDSKSGWFPIPSRKIVQPQLQVSVEGMSSPASSTSILKNDDIGQESDSTAKPKLTGRKSEAETSTKEFGGNSFNRNCKQNVFDEMKECLKMQNWKRLSTLLLLSRDLSIIVSRLAELFMDLSGVNISKIFQKLAYEILMPSDVKVGHKKHVVGLVGIHVIEKCTDRNNLSAAFGVLMEMLKQKNYFYRCRSQENSAAEITKKAIEVCVNVGRYDVINFLLRQLDFFRSPHFRGRDVSNLIKQKYCCLNVVLVAIIQKLPTVKNQQMDSSNGNQVILCNTGITILTEVLKDWTSDMKYQTEISELIELSATFAILVQGCIVHQSTDGLMKLAQLQERYPEYLKWNVQTLHAFVLHFLQLDSPKLFLNEDAPARNILQLAAELNVLPKLPAYVPFKINTIYLWSSLSDLEMRLLICGYLKSITEISETVKQSVISFNVKVIDHVSVLGQKTNVVEGFNTLLRVISRSFNLLRWTRMSQNMITIESPSVYVIRNILSHMSITFKENVLPGFRYQETFGDTDFRQFVCQKTHNEIEETQPESPYLTATTQQPVKCINRFNSLPSGILTAETPESVKRQLSFMPTVEKSARKSISGTPESAKRQCDFVSAAERSARKVLLKTPLQNQEVPQLLQSNVISSKIGVAGSVRLPQSTTSCRVPFSNFRMQTRPTMMPKQDFADSRHHVIRKIGPGIASPNAKPISLLELRLRRP